MTHPTCKAGRTEAGYTYVTMLVALVAMALAAQVTVVPTATEVRRATEEELIFRGLAYADAIENYYFAGTGELRYPADLADLLEDPRNEGQRHIRRLYASVTGTAWQPLPADDGGIIGVTVTSPHAPFRIAQLPPRVFIDQNSDGYTVWEFVSDVSR